jgi:hypothetical protein
MEPLATSSGRSSPQMAGSTGHTPTRREMAEEKRRLARERLNAAQYRALIRQHGGWWTNVPTHDREVMRMAAGLDPATEAALIATLSSGSITGLQPSASPATVNLNSSLTSPRRAASASKLREYIRRPVAGLSTQGSFRVDSAQVLKALQELRLRIPPFRRMVAGHGTDLASEDVQRACFGDLFGLIDEFGEGCVSIEQVEGFGRKVGVATTRLLSRPTFTSVLDVERRAVAKENRTAAGGGALTRDDFLVALFPAWAARRRAEQLAARAAGVAIDDLAASLPATALSASVSHWSDGWHADDVAVMQRIMRLYGSGDTISFAQLRAALPREQEGPQSSLDAMLDKFDGDHDGTLSTAEAAAFFKPSFDASRRREDDEPILYFKDVKAPW